MIHNANSDLKKHKTTKHGDTHYVSAAKKHLQQMKTQHKSMCGIWEKIKDLLHAVATYWWKDILCARNLVLTTYHVWRSPLDLPFPNIVVEFVIGYDQQRTSLLQRRKRLPFWTTPTWNRVHASSVNHPICHAFTTTTLILNTGQGLVMTEYHNIFFQWEVKMTMHNTDTVQYSIYHS